MTGRYEGDCCPACGSYQVLPYAVILGGREEYGYHCQDCQITWRVLTHDPASAGADITQEPGGMSDPALTLIPVLTDTSTGTGASTRTLHDELLEPRRPRRLPRNG